MCPLYTFSELVQGGAGAGTRDSRTTSHLTMVCGPPSSTATNPATPATEGVSPGDRMAARSLAVCPSCVLSSSNLQQYKFLTQLC